jgi:hypothetical protein
VVDASRSDELSLPVVAQAGEPASAEPEWEGVDRMSDRPDRSLDYVARQAAKRNQPIRVRVTLSLLDPKSGQYKGWRGMNWKVPVRDTEEARRLQDLLELFFDCIDLGGIVWSTEVMAGAKRVLVDAQRDTG